MFIEFSYNKRFCKIQNVVILGTAILLLFQVRVDKIITTIFIDGSGPLHLQATTTADENNEINLSFLHFDADHPNNICSKFTTAPSSSAIWKLLKSEILSASYFPESYSANERFREWVDELYSFYTPERLRLSISSPGSNQAISRIIEILLAYPRTKQPLQILVSGGSVTAGHGCKVNPVGIQDGPNGNNPWKDCAWPIRLQHLWNHIFFGGEEGVQISNMAMGGSSSETAAIFFEYNLLPKEHPIPHIILLSHSANDVQEKDPNNEVFYKHMQNLAQSAQNLRSCDDNLPLVVMVDDFYALTTRTDKTIEQTGKFYSIASWFRLMSISYGNVVRHEVLSRYVNYSLVDPIMGSHYDLHMGMGFHIGMAWTIMFNFIHSFRDVCCDDNDGLKTAQSVLDWFPNETSNTLNLRGLDKKRAPSKYIGKLSTSSTPETIASEWKEEVKTKEIRCQNASLTEYEPRCEYAWMANRVTGIDWPRDIIKAMSPILKITNGWAAKGNRIKQPRTGWYAEKGNATFSLKIPVKKVETNYFTILIMKSYGPNFMGTKLAMDVRVEHQSNAEDDDHGSYEVTGYHSEPTSIHVPFKFRLPGNGASVGDTIFFDAKLVEGMDFKIAGMAFCKF